MHLKTDTDTVQSYSEVVVFPIFVEQTGTIMAFPGRRGRGRGGWGRRGWGPRPWGPRRPGLGLVGAVVGGAVVGAAVAPRRRPRVIVANPNYPAARVAQSAPKVVIVDILKEGFLEIEYTFIMTYYKKRYFVLKSNLKLEYYDSPQTTHRKPSGVIDLRQCQCLRKEDGGIFSIEINNHSNAGAVDLKKLFSAEVTEWRFKCDGSETESAQKRNEWFAVISSLISSDGQKPITYIERKSGDNKKDVLQPSAPPEPAVVAEPGGGPQVYDNNNGNAFNSENENQYADEGQVTNQ